jgi:hypothetical protein
VGRQLTTHLDNADAILLRERQQAWALGVSLNDASIENTDYVIDPGGYVL